MLKALQHRPILSILLIVLLMLVFSSEAIPVSIMEARNFITAREMLQDGNWLLTTMNGKARYEKPPLPTWLTALSAMIFGIKSLTALRLPAILFVAFIGIYTFLFSKKLLSNTQQSFNNALIVITSFYVIGITLEAPWDIFTHGFMLMAIYHLFQLFRSQKTDDKHMILASLFMGCSILCKGPISVYALLLPFLLAYGFSFRYKNFKPKMIPVLNCLVLALIVGGWWFLYVRLNDPNTFEAIATKETNNWHSYNTKPIYYYWSFFTQSGIWTIPAFISLLYPYLKTRVSNLKAYQFSLFWTIFAVVLLSLVPEKKSRYLMPVLIPLAINIGFYIDYLIRNFKILKSKKEIIPVYFNFGLIALIAIGLPIALFIVAKDSISERWLMYGLSTVISLFLGVLIFLHLKKKQMENVFLLTVAFFVSIFVFVVPIMKPIIGTENHPISKLDTKSLKVYGLSAVSPEMIWHYGDKIPPLKLHNGTFNFPKENRFGMFGIHISAKDWEVLKRNYEVEKTGTIDLNIVPKDSKRHNDRLVNEFYILTKL